MAKVTVKMPDEFLLKISRLGDQTDAIVERVLQAGGRVMLEKVRSNLTALKFSERSTGQLLSSLGLSPVKVDKKGIHNIKVGFDEPRRDGRSNAMIANILEYGKTGQPARPFLAPAKKQAKQACIDAMAASLEEEIAKI